MSSSRNRTAAPSPIPQPDDERYDPSLRARTPPPPPPPASADHVPSSAVEVDKPAQDVPGHERTASNSGRPPAPTNINITTAAAHTGNRPHAPTNDTINSLNTTQTDQSLGDSSANQQVTVTFGTPSQSVKKRAATGGTPNTEASSAAQSAASSNLSHDGSPEQHEHKAPSLPETPPATPSGGQAGHEPADAYSGEEGISTSSSKEEVSPGSTGRGGARWVDAETHARNNLAASGAGAASAAGNVTAPQPTTPAAAKDSSAGQPTAASTSTSNTNSNPNTDANPYNADNAKSTGTSMALTTPTPIQCWGTNLLKLANSASGGLLSPKIQPAFVVDGGDGDGSPSDEEGRRSKYAGVYDDDGEDAYGAAQPASSAGAANTMDPNLMDGPASGGEEKTNHKASSSHPSDTAAAAAATDETGIADKAGGGEGDGYVELNTSSEQKRGQKKRQQQQRTSSAEPQSFVDTLYENVLDVCDGCAAAAGMDGEGGAGMGGGFGALPVSPEELGETAHELYAAATLSFDTLVTDLQSMMNLGPTSDADGEGGGGGVNAKEAAAASASEVPHQQDYLAPTSYYTERDRLFEEAEQYEAAGNHEAALACLERCLTQTQAMNGRHDLSLPALGKNNGGQGSGEEYLRHTASTSTNEAEVLHKMGIILWKAGSYEASLGRLLDGLAIYRRSLKITPKATRRDSAIGESSGNASIRLINPDADLMADILNSIGRVYFSRGDYAQAMRYYNESLALQTDVYADAFAAMDRPASPMEDLVSLSSGQSGHPGVNTIQSVQSFDSAPEGDLQEPLSPPPPPLSPQSPPISPTMSVASRKRRKAAIMHPGVARTTICMGMVHEAQGRYSRAMRFYKDGLRAQRSALGNDHVDVAATLNAMGSLYEKTGDIQFSMKCFEGALDIYRSRLGNDHTDTAVTLNNVGQVQLQLKEYDHAMESYSEALRIMKKNLGDGHRNVAATMHNIGLVYTARGQYSDALKIYRTVLNSQRAALGDMHFDVAVTLDSVASAYEGQGRYEKAAKFYGKALRVRRAALGRDHVFVGLTLDRIGTFHLNVDRNYSEAVRRFDEAKAVYEANSLDENDSRVKDVLAKLETAIELDAEARAAVDF